MTQAVSLHQVGPLVGAKKQAGFYELHYQTGEVARLYILSPSMVRFYLDPAGNFTHPDFDFDQQAFDRSQARATQESLIVQNGQLQIIFGINPSTFTIFDGSIRRNRVQLLSPFEYSASSAKAIIKQSPNEYYFGAGRQKQAYSHKADLVKFKPSATSVPFFFSNAGYGQLLLTKEAAQFDFGKHKADATIVTNFEPVFDAVYFLAKTPAAIIKDLYHFIGQPEVPAQFATGLGYLSNFVDQGWQETDGDNRHSVKLEDGKFYVKSQNRQTDHAEQFSAHAMLKRYARWQIPLNWFVPNYQAKSSFLPDSQALFELAQQTNTYIAFMENGLARFTNQSQRSLDLQLANTADEHNYPLLLTSPDSSWEQIRRQIIALLSLSLTGKSIAGDAVSGSVALSNAEISLRDWEWKTFTPLLFTADSDSLMFKTPFTFNKKYTRIVQAYLELRQKLAAYLMNLFNEVQDGAPVMRPLFYEFPEELANYRQDFAHEFMLGKDILVAPIMSGKQDAQGNSIKDNLYLPGKHTIWSDLLTGQRYLGGQVYNNLQFENWHLPVFVRSGAIIQLSEKEALLYPQDQTSQDLTLETAERQLATRTLTSHLSNQQLTVHLGKASSQQVQSNEFTFNIRMQSAPAQVTLRINGEKVELTQTTAAGFAEQTNCFTFNQHYPIAPKFVQYGVPNQPVLQVKVAELAPTDEVELSLNGFQGLSNPWTTAIVDSAFKDANDAKVLSDQTTAHSFTLAWSKDLNAEVLINDVLYTNLGKGGFTFHELQSDHRYAIKVRYRYNNKASEWSNEMLVQTKPDQSNFAINQVQVSANFAANQLDTLVDGDEDTELLTDFTDGAQLTFNFEQVEKLSRMTYTPRTIDYAGRITGVKVETSLDGQTFTPYSESFTWNPDTKIKVIGLRDVSAKAIRLTILSTTEHKISGKEVTFYKPKK